MTDLLEMQPLMESEDFFEVRKRLFVQQSLT